MADLASVMQYINYYKQKKDQAQQNKQYYEQKAEEAQVEIDQDQTYLNEYADQAKQIEQEAIRAEQAAKTY